MPAEFCSEYAYYDDYKSPWIATHVVNDKYPLTREGATLQEAYDSLYDELAKSHKKRSWYEQMINVDGKQAYGLVVDMRNDGNYYSPGLRLFMKLVGIGESPEQAIYDGFNSLGSTITQDMIDDLCLGKTNKKVPGCSLHPLSDTALEYFYHDEICSEYSVVIVDGVVEKESRLQKNKPMDNKEWASLRALYD